MLCAARRHRALALVPVLAVAGLALAGCGGGGEDDGEPAVEEELAFEEGEEGLSEEERELAEREEAAAEIPEADRVAYYQLATTSGLLRARALADRRGEPVPPDSTDAGLRAARERLRELESEEALLRRARTRLEPGIGAALAGARNAEAALRSSDQANLQLDRYVHREPLIAVFVPD